MGDWRMSNRRFTLIDAMALVAATAVGLTMARAYDPRFSGEPLPDFLKRGWGAPACLMVALALVLILLMSQRHSPRHALLEPGMAACYSSAMAVVFSITLNALHLLVSGRLLTQATSAELFNYVAHDARPLIPWAVAGAWLSLAAMGHWRSATSWIERTGRAIGLYWCLYPVLETTAPVLVRLIPLLH
jgi:hypothetical protein